MNKIKIVAFMAFALVLTGIATTASTAEAACSYNGYMNSNGRCGVSYYNTQPVYYYGQPQVLGQHTVNEEYLRQLIAQLQEQLRLLQQQQNSNYYYPYTYYNNYSYRNVEVDVVTRSADDIEDEEAVLRADVDMEDSDRVTVWFEYGESSNDLDEETTHRVFYDDDDLDPFRQRVTDLDDDTRYYFRAVAKDENGRKDYGSILSFRTDDDGHSSNDDDEPDVDTRDAEDISDDSAELNGRVDMNDFNNGEVFFVYGEDEDQIEDVEDEYDSYSDVDEDGDDLQKVRVDSDLDGNQSYSRDVLGLDNDTRIYYTICVGYEDEDDDDVLECGDVEDFRTDD